MKARRFALVAALTLALTGPIPAAYAGWEDPIQGPHGVTQNADLEFAMQVAGTSLAVVRAAR
jgi:hypothetical protein